MLVSINMRDRKPCIKNLSYLGIPFIIYILCAYQSLQITQDQVNIIIAKHAIIPSYGRDLSLRQHCFQPANKSQMNSYPYIPHCFGHSNSIIKGASPSHNRSTCQYTRFKSPINCFIHSLVNSEIIGINNQPFFHSFSRP